MIPRRPWIAAFIGYVALLGTEKDLDAVYHVADSMYPDSRLMDPEEAAASQFGPVAELQGTGDKPIRLVPPKPWP
jgi:hypothetical protein